MITRYYFIKVESKPTIRSKRISANKITICTGTFSIKSLLPDPHLCIKKAMEKIVDTEKDFLMDEIILTDIRRI